MLGVKAGRGHRRLEVKAQPFLNAEATQFRRALREVKEEHEVEHDRRGKDRIAAEEVDFDLHGIAEPSEDVDVVPTFFVITTWWVIVNADLVEDVSVKFGIKLRLQDVLEC